MQASFTRVAPRRSFRSPALAQRLAFALYAVALLATLGTITALLERAAA